MTSDGVNALVYDAENHAISSGGSLGSGTFTYEAPFASRMVLRDANGLRVQKASVVNGNSTTTVHIFSRSKVVAEYVNGAAPTAPTREYIYSGGTVLLAKIDSTGTHYYHQDLVSNRLVTDSSGNVAEQLGHYPYGESWYNATNDKLFFTTYERDSESGNDYAQARYYVSRVARFSAVDPIGGAIGDAQSNNGYAYTENDPVNLIDPSGAIMIVAPYPFSPDPFLPWGPFDGFGDGQILPCGSISEDDGFDSIFTDPTSGINYVTSNCYSAGKTGGGGGGQCNSVPASLRVGCIANNAIQRVLGALKNEKCRNLFASNVDPGTLLQNLAAGDAGVGVIQVADLGGPVMAGGVGSVTAADTQGILGSKTVAGPNGTTVRQSTFTGATITINNNPQAPFTTGFGNFLSYLGAPSFETMTAITIIHELGHAADLIYGPNASAIADDQGSSLRSIGNTINVLLNCF